MSSSPTANSMCAEIIAILEKFAEPQSVERCTWETSLYHDLGMSGDDAIEFLTYLQGNHDVDLKGFEFDLFFPPEYYGRTYCKSIVLAFLPFSNYLIRRRTPYAPLTLRMVAEAISAKRFSYDPTALERRTR